MKYNAYLFLIFFISFSLFGQNTRKIIDGKILNDSLSVENIHIINKNSHKATISNLYGEFQIPVQRNDTILISSIQFEHKTIIITDIIIKNKKLSVYVFPKINQLEEVVVKEYQLSGNLKTDVNTTKIEHVADQFTLKLPNAGRVPVPTIDSLDISIGLIMAVNLEALYRRINGDFKKLKKLQKLQKEDDVLKIIRSSVTDKYFIDSLKIPKDHIENFLHYLVFKDIVKLYRQGKEIEVIDLIIKESTTYRKFKNLK